MDSLPTDVIQTIALYLDYASLLSLRLVSSRFNKDTYRNESFWARKFLQEFGDYSHPVESWRILYRDTGNIIHTCSHDIAKFVRHTKAKDILYGTSAVTERIDSFNEIIKNLMRYTILQADGSVLVITIGSRNLITGVQHIIPLNIGIVGGVKMMAQSHLSTLYLTNDNRLLNQNLVNQIVNVDIIFVAAGHDTEYAIDIDNNVWGRGLSLPGNQTSFMKFIKIPNLKGKYISTGKNNTAMIDMNDNVWTWSHDKLDARLPQIITDIKAKLVACSDKATFLIDLDGIVWVSEKTGFSKIPEFRAKYLSVRTDRSSEQEIMFVDLEDNVYIYQAGPLGPIKSLSYKAYKPIGRDLSISLGYTPTIAISNKTIFIISYDRLKEKLNDEEIADYNILPQLQHLKKNSKNTMVLFRDIYDKLSVCEVDYYNHKFLRPLKS